ncbi:hypothetical protein CCB80_09890 [Armatimonadetes bacterium Uphvl-Ar1]|nr:hypothetical protein CCB80_09890 [Armatimonadetes bacterium Uphvl-Ar1]
MLRIPAYLALLLASILLVGCNQTPPADDYITSMPTGLWVGTSNSDLGLDIQDDGTLKLTSGAQETLGTWQKKDDSTLTITLNGETIDSPFQRKDLDLTITLPGNPAPQTFTQM